MVGAGTGGVHMGFLLLKIRGLGTGRRRGPFLAQLREFTFPSSVPKIMKRKGGLAPHLLFLAYIVELF